MCRCDPPTGPVNVKFSKETRRIAGRSVDIWHARCQEDGHTSTGDTQAEAAKDFAPHMRQHLGRTIKKVD